ncbi:MAG: N-acetylmuramoyl-L-alanine amidase [Candidatus Omnitrophica bacterium]|nr:N-acetylmuramoyl-L-alanine amidase [Candidatus Omnitrophota bacterium]
MPHPTIAVPLRSPVTHRQAPLPGPIQRIVVDAGHGGHDPGTSHHGLQEKHLVLDMSRRLRDQLRDAGLDVTMTRESDQFIALEKRPAVANRLGADLFVSVHVNASPNSRKISGVEVYYPRVSVVSSSNWPAFLSPNEIGTASPDVRQVVWDLVLSKTRSQSRRLATAICRSMRTQLRIPCLGVKAARFVVLREAWMPSVLVEVGYVTNREEAGRLGTAEYRQAAAEAMAEGIVSYVRELGVQHI